MTDTPEARAELIAELTRLGTAQNNYGVRQTPGDSLWPVSVRMLGHLRQAALDAADALAASPAPSEAEAKWLCGKCGGANVPLHHRTCELRGTEDRAEPESEWCFAENCRYRNWRSDSTPTHKRGGECPAPVREPGSELVQIDVDSEGHPVWGYVPVRAEPESDTREQLAEALYGGWNFETGNDIPYVNHEGLLKLADAILARFDVTEKADRA